MALIDIAIKQGTGPTGGQLFESIAADIACQGYSIKPAALPAELIEPLLVECINNHSKNFKQAGIGRGDDFIQNEFVRTDKISWINSDTRTGALWLDWTNKLQAYLNRRLFLGLNTFESHFAHYAPGNYYKRHLDAFSGQQNRILSIVVYLNSNWVNIDGGELVLYQDELDKVGIKTTPLSGTIVVFLSEEFPHEVLPARRDRYSIAGWFRAKNSDLLN